MLRRVGQSASSDSLPSAAQREKLEIYALRLAQCKMAIPIHHYSDILIVDDSGATRSIVRKILSQLGYKKIDEASSGAAALKKISEGHFNLIISDWNMEEMSGDELLERVRADKNYESLPFIMMTADSTIDKIIKAKRARVSCFIRKPFGAEELEAKISQINTEQRSIARP
jgi:two-component system, chemotaxis family, chemotaxis protein CheY